MDVDILRRHAADQHEPFVVLDVAELQPRVESVVAARRLARAGLAPLRVAPDRMDDLVLAVSEAFTNAVEAQRRGGVTSGIVVRCIAAIDTLAVEVEDHAGGGTDFADTPGRPTLSDRNELGPDRGWGIRLMRELVDHVAFESTPDGTLVRLAVRR